MFAQAVIGANYGDEGKGLITDFLASCAIANHCVVVRINGGAQAGHTVECEDGKRHVFRHFGSGSLANASTFLSKFFIVNPIEFRREYSELPNVGKFSVLVDPQCVITTPFDIMLNHAREKKNKHGSCGAGIFATISRREHRIYFADICNPRALRIRLAAIRENFASPLPDPVIDRVVEKFLDDCDFMFRKTIPAFWDEVVSDGHRHFIFEGAQGLALDQNNAEDFPHLTPSNTGIQNAVELCKEANIADLETFYVSRAYLTRHGNGPFASELPGKPFDRIDDPTNVPNEFQGTIRYAHANVPETLRRIEKDKKHAIGINHLPRVAVTCMDQVPTYFPAVLEIGGKEEKVSARDFLDAMNANLVSFGPKRSDVFENV